MDSGARYHPNVLLISDGRLGGEGLAARLRGEGVRLEVAPTVTAAGPWLRLRSFQVVLVDLVTLATGGLALCRRLAEDRSLRIIALGATQDDADAIVSLESGADDYVHRSSSPRQILARIRAQARRLEVNAKLMSTVEFHGFAWDLRRRQLSTPWGTLLTLSASELSLLMAFLQSGGRNLSREELLELVSRDGVRVGVRALDSHVSRLRRKLALHGGKGLISTVHGFGYRWARAAAISEPAARVPRSFGAPFSLPSSLPPASAG